MSQSIFASFQDPVHAKKAAGALLDHGVLDTDLSLVVNEVYMKNNPQFLDDSPIQEEGNTAKHGVTTTSGADAASGAGKGAGVGVVVGILGALASLVIPGFGLVIGGGALATALGAAAGTAAAGAIAGGVTGYLKDQGVPDADAARYQDTIGKGGAMIAVQAPSGKANTATIEELLAKYGARCQSYAPRI